MSINVYRDNAGKEVISFDLSKVAAAIAKAFENIQPMIDEIIENTAASLMAMADTLGEYTEQLMNRFESSAHSVMHLMLHVLAHCFYSARDFFSEVVTYHRRSRIRRIACYVIIILVNCTPLARGSMAPLWVSRRINLFRRQDRGSNEPASDNDNYTFIFA